MNTLDLVVALATLIFGLVGAWSGFSKQVGQSVATIAAFAGAAPLGRFFGQALSQSLKCSLFVGVVLATVLGFVVVFLVARFVVTSLVRKFLSGDSKALGASDRVLGFLLGSTKAFAIAYAGICAATMIENNLVFGGRKLAFTPKNSVLVALSREYNLIELQQFSDGKALLNMLRTLSSSNLEVKDNKDFTSLVKDPRVQRLLSTDILKQALESGDLKTLLKSDEASQLLFDAKIQRLIYRLSKSENSPRKAPEKIGDAPQGGRPLKR
jgi:membrane protein required for colicin V production